MRVKPFINILLFLCSSFIAGAQDTTILISPGKTTLGYIPLGNVDGWIFRQGHDVAWAKNDIDTTGWKKIKPSELSEKLTDKNGKLEGWLRIKIKLDTAFSNKPIGLHMSAWAASEVYVDGNLLHTYGNTGVNGMPFKEYNPTYKLPVPLNIQTGGEHIIAAHIVDFRSPYPPFHLKSQGRLSFFISITTPEYNNRYLSSSLRNRTFRTSWLAANAILCLLFWLLAFQNREEKNLIFIALTTTILTINIYCDQYIIIPGITYNFFGFLILIWPILISVGVIIRLLLMLRLFNRRASTAFKIILGIIFLCGIVRVFYDSRILLIAQVTLSILVLAFYVAKSWKTLKGAQWAVLTGILLAISFGLALTIVASIMPGPNLTVLLLYTGLFLSFPLSLLVYVAMRFKEIIREVRQRANQVVQLSEEKKEQAVNQQKVLQAEVDRQTAELRNTLENLKATQSQLIQSEKMASLGELTAGIAHEIQNPLNFVNNFSDVNKELIDEMEQEMDKGNLTDAKGIAKDIRENEAKINQHGKRADAIVKGMLQHSRTSSGQKEPTDINALCDEYLRLAFHGFRARDKAFNVTMKTDFDSSIDKISLIPQDIGRVIMNLINNAFYAVSEKEKQNLNGYEPTVMVSTKKSNDKVEISVKDNGNGIPQNVFDKIFQPFFTTKPTGQGTGLGLSLSYDIVKAHGGEIKADTKEGEETIFTIQLPVK